MTSEPLEGYLSRLQRELDKRGLGDGRIVEEAREHLVDAVEDGLKRGLSVEAAEREALVRFGAPEHVAAHAVAERRRVINGILGAGVGRVVHRILTYVTFVSASGEPQVPIDAETQTRGAHMTTQRNNSFAGSLGMVWRRKWWILVPTVLSVVVTSVVSHYFLPTRYLSEASILVVPRRVAPEYVHSTVTGHLGDRVQQMNAIIMSRSRLERLITDFNLYELERRNAPIEDVIGEMRQDIKINMFTSQDPQENEMGGFRVSFVSADPRAAQKVTQRLASFYIEENLRDREMRAEGTLAFIDAQIVDVRDQIVAYERRLETLRTESGGRHLSQADVLPYEVLQETYKALLTKSQESRIAASLERRQIGEQFKILEPARLPERPVGPSRVGVNVMGGLAGLGLALTFVGVSSVRQPHPERNVDTTSA